MDLLIVGASARAAAFSAVRAGLRPAAVDLFADRDLAAVARCVRVPPAAYPSSLVDATADFGPCPWIYTGALENHPATVAEIARRRPLWGNPAETLRRVRDPLAVWQALHDAGVPAPETRGEPDGLPLDGSWLRKPIASGGGRGVVPLRAAGRSRGPERPSPQRSYYQKRVGGLPVSAVFVAHASGTLLAGVTLQLTGYAGSNFAYRGTLAPWPVSERERAGIMSLGELLAREFGLVGLFGVDLILQGETPWPVEVNPRYTASVEVLELASRCSLLAAHRTACEGGELLPMPAVEPGGKFVAKEIVFAPGQVIFPVDALGAARHDLATYEVPALADIPDPGAHFRAGEPVLTVFASGSTPDETLKRLAAARRHWEAQLRPVGGQDDVAVTPSEG